MSAELTVLAMACTKKQRHFANELAAGVPVSEAYRRAYNTTAKDSALSSKAAKAQKSTVFAAYYSALIAQGEKKRYLTRERKREKLAGIVEDHAQRAADRIKAIEVDNVMTGDNAPQQVQVFGLSDLLAMVRKGNR